MKSQKWLVILLSLSFVLFSCGTPAGQGSTGGSTQVQELGFKVPKNAQGHTAEQQNIIDRIKVTTDPTKVLWIHLISLNGQIVLRTPVAGKVTSSGKRLEPTTVTSASGSYVPRFVVKDASGAEQWYYTEELLQPDGTFGSSDPYIYWFDPMHRYHQWGTAGGLGYLLTDYPIDLTNPKDLISGMYNMDLLAYQWQQAQEAIMCANQGRTYENGVCQ
ncbi:TPA: hypothetical protein DIU27_04240 [Candidatus Collierbacteria bacterium]|uniref:Uncharacterized protein n=1 Tax=Candidatus Collierbacteria bacterium GW2011_GWB2_44_22 TaxID=1618387 RepID=A0A0G1K5W4_9BACT|nr:MAG: hypothetical protein UW31_C0013G0003 [Candidatus Collierbacteria bacterium GW2011_GWA2_44_13]KKT51682.1 MAG: hypothetical protein UW44_C0008G0004 [Candidatus Collierbacteria bacterium GW2011_GWB2_44_22]KKT62480.1 MAG: hypothetical protein UW56_C0006G0003 [Candidatus Collierbacteria bacterium GW2011_GWD1_44_27]KKT66900.1 MAG: hypothetical protein UW58_C0001G0004 [Candidatus Collierbacteria bacterium GW2011_GWC2_44_30]KKT88729.1 MAG: hypothetical protein UW88_C0008G0003 [Candidatus Collie